MGMAGPIFELNPQNFGKSFIFLDEQMILLPFLYISHQTLANLEKPIFSLYSRPLTVKIFSKSTVSGLAHSKLKIEMGVAGSIFEPLPQNLVIYSKTRMTLRNV